MFTLGIVKLIQFDGGVRVDGKREILRLAVYANSQHFLCQTLRNRLSDLKSGYAFSELADTPIRESNVNHKPTNVYVLAANKCRQDDF